MLLLPILAGCGAALPEQSPEQIRAELAKIPAPRPGLWEAHFTLTDFSASGAPEGADERIRRELEARGRLGQISCLTPELAKKAVEDGFVRFDGAFCQIQALHVTDDAYEARLSCEAENRTVASVHLNGPLTGDVMRSTSRVELALKDKPDARISFAIDQTDRFKGDCPAG